MDNIGSVIAYYYIMRFFIIILLFGGLVFFITRRIYKTNEIQSNVRITPKIRLKTDGVKIDTIFIYSTKIINGK